MAWMKSGKGVVATNINGQSCSGYKRGEVVQYSHPLHNVNKKTIISARDKNLDKLCFPKFRAYH